MPALGGLHMVIGHCIGPHSATVSSACCLGNSKMAKRKVKPAPEASMGLSYQVKQELLLIWLWQEEFSRTKAQNSGMARKLG